MTGLGPDQTRHIVFGRRVLYPLTCPRVNIGGMHDNHRKVGGQGVVRAMTGGGATETLGSQSFLLPVNVVLWTDFVSKG